MNAARTRIGRVRLKGGATLHVLPQRDPSPVLDHIREWVRGFDRWAEPPSAFVAIAFWKSPQEPWRASHTIDWMTCDPDLPLPRLMRVSATHIEARAPALLAEDRVMLALGYTRDDDPDPAA